MTDVLVTGLDGFVGSHLARRLPSRALAIDGVPVDLRDAAEVGRAIAQARPEAVVHLAAQSSVAQSLRNPRETFDINFAGTLNLLSGLEAAGFRGRMLYVGTGDVYGSVDEAQLPVGELAPARPRNPYAVSKVAAEALCYQWSQTGPFEIVMARPFNHIGPGQARHFAVADFAWQIVAHREGKGASVLQVGDITATRDFTDVRDIVLAYELLLKRGVNGEAYNVCSGTELSLDQIIRGLFRAAGVTMEVRVDSSRLRPSEQRRMCGSYAKLAAHTGWSPGIGIDQTLADILEDCERKEVP